MTIDDELILLLLKLENGDRVGKNAPIIEIVGTREFDFELEESTQDLKYDLIGLGLQGELVQMTPDITVTVPPKHGKEIAIELENDIDWDFQKSLRKAKKYKVKFDDARVIIPKKYEKFAPLYQHEGFRVYLWEATRVWQCIKCRSINESKETLSPKCPTCKKYGRHRFIEAKDAKFEEYK